MVEAAFVLPLLLLMIIGIFDFSLLFYKYQSMELGISEATRYGITGQQLWDPATGTFLSRDESIKSIMRGFNFLIVLNNSDFTFDHLSGTSWVAGSGGPCDVSRVTVRYDWKPITPLIGAVFPGGHIPLRASSTMRNECF